VSLAQPIPQGEYCPNCGGMATYLLDITGWCPSCTEIAYPDKRVCSTCGGLFKRTAHTEKCWTCRKEQWLAKHADRLEELLRLGLSLTAAKEQVANEIRPHCTRCGIEVRGARVRNAPIFCKTTPECKKARYDYDALLATGLSPDAALAIATKRVQVLSN